MEMIRLGKLKEKASNWSCLEQEWPASELGHLVSSAPMQELNHTHGLQSSVAHRKKFAWLGIAQEHLTAIPPLSAGRKHALQAHTEA